MAISVTSRSSVLAQLTNHENIPLSTVGLKNYKSINGLKCSFIQNFGNGKMFNRPIQPLKRTTTYIRASESENNGGLSNNRKKVVVVGAGWAGLGAAHHLAKQVVIQELIFMRFDPEIF